MDARYLIFDEVTSMLDPEGSVMILKLILDLVRRGKTVVLVTHNTDLAVYADTLVLMKNGQIIARDKPRVLFNRKNLIEDCALRQPGRW